MCKLIIHCQSRVVIFYRKPRYTHYCSVWNIILGVLYQKCTIWVIPKSDLQIYIKCVWCSISLSCVVSLSTAPACWYIFITKHTRKTTLRCCARKEGGVCRVCSVCRQFPSTIICSTSFMRIIGDIKTNHSSSLRVFGEGGCTQIARRWRRAYHLISQFQRPYLSQKSHKVTQNSYTYQNQSNLKTQSIDGRY